MSFGYPLILVLLVIPAVLMFRVWRRERAQVVLPFDHAHRRPGRWLRFPLNAADTLPALVLAIAILLLAAPQQLGAPQEKRVLTNIEFCVDVSGSMTAEFGEGTRYDASMAAINEFLDARQGDAFGLTFFGNNVLHWVPLTSDASAIRCSPPFMRPEVVPYWFGGTEIAKALLACREVLRTREEGDRMIILVSDGYSSDLRGERPFEIAKQMSADNIAIYSIHVGGGDVPDDIVNVTALTSGEAFEAGDTDGLKRIFERIDQMKPARLERTAPEVQDDFLPYCLAGLGILGLSLFSSFGMRYTPW